MDEVGLSRASAQVFVVVGAAVLVLFGVFFKKRQERGGLGGSISRAKTFWLCFAIFFWFIVAPAVGMDESLPLPLRRVFLAVGASMWLRGVVEMVMLYVTRNWRPPFGVAHDIVTILLILGALVVGATEPVSHDATSIATAALVVALLASLIIEIVHARTFFAVVGRGTVGDDGVWFADEHDPRFTAINRRTRLWNCILCTAVLFYFIAWFTL